MPHLLCMFSICSVLLCIRLLLTITHKATVKTIECCVCVSPERSPKGRISGSRGLNIFDFIRTHDTTCQSGCVSLPPSRSVCALASWSCQQQVDFTLCLVVIHGCVVARLMIFSSLCWFEHSLLWSADSYSSHFFYEVDFFLLVWRIF